MITSHKFYETYETELMKKLKSRGFKLKFLDSSFEEYKENTWACAYVTEENKEGLGLFKKPVRGRIVNRYFHEYKKDGKSLKKQAVSVYARYYCDTEQECKDFYNALIDIENEKLKYLIYKNEQQKIN